MEAVVKDCINNLTGKNISDDSEIVTTLQKFLAEKDIPLNINDPAILLETASVFLNIFSQDMIRSINILKGKPETYMDLLNREIESYEQRYVLNNKIIKQAIPKYHLQPNKRKKDQKMIESLIKVVIKIYPHVVVRWLDKGVSFYVGDYSVIVYNRLFLHDGLILGNLTFGMLKTKDDVCSTFPEQFLKHKIFSMEKLRPTLKPVSMAEVIEVVQTYQIGFNK